MIKLKDIINEISINHPKTVRWESEPGTPDAIINAIHRIMETVIKNKEPGRPVRAYIKSFKLKDKNDAWVIQNSFNPDVFIVYVKENDMWLAPDNVDGKARITSLSKNGLDLMIKNWMV